MVDTNALINVNSILWQWLYMARTYFKDADFFFSQICWRERSNMSVCVRALDTFIVYILTTENHCTNSNNYIFLFFSLHVITWLWWYWHALSL